jgi:hypothetical protein
VSVQVINWVFRHSRSRGASRLVLLALADVASDQGEVKAYARGYSVLGLKANIAKKNVGRAMEDLVKLGELVRLNGGSGNVESDYLILMHQSPRDEVADTSERDVDDDEGVLTTSTPDDEGVLTTRTPGPQAADPGSSPRGPITSLPSSPSSSSSRGEEPLELDPAGDDDDLFDQAIQILVDQRVAGRQLQNPAYYRDRVADSIRRIFAARAAELRAENPLITAAELAGVLEPPPPPPPAPTVDPLEATGAAHRRKQEENEDHLAAERARAEAEEMRRKRADALLAALSPDARAALEEQVRTEFTRAPRKAALAAAMREAVLKQTEEVT